MRSSLDLLAQDRAVKRERAYREALRLCQTIVKEALDEHRNYDKVALVGALEEIERVATRTLDGTY